MEDQYNLIYNGKMLHGMDGYLSTSQTSIDTSDKPVGCAGSFIMNNLEDPYWVFTSTVKDGLTSVIPFINTDTYKLSLQIKDNGTTYSRDPLGILLSWDNKGKFLQMGDTAISDPNGETITTLAQDLNNGDTIVYLTDVTNWNTSISYGVFGIIESAAYKDNRNLWCKGIVQNSKDTTNNTITLSSAWDGGTYKAGSKVREFISAGTYIYPFTYSSSNPIPSDWNNITRNDISGLVFSDTNQRTRLAHSYFISLFICRCNAKVADLRFENLSCPQLRIPMNMQNEMSIPNIASYTESTSSVNQYGQLNTGMLSEGFLPVRYIRDWCGQSTSNNYGVWQRIRAYDRLGRDVAFAADGTWDGEYSRYIREQSRGQLNRNNTTTYKPMHIITNNDDNWETVWLSKNLGPDGDAYPLTIDMGIIHYINKIIIWHYFLDDRTHHKTKTEVSADGVNWITVFDSAIEGEYVETADGHMITFDKLGTLYHVSFKKGGEALVQDIIED